VRRALLAALAAFVLAGWLLAPGQLAPASAGTVAGACTTSKGVTVVVNFASLGGGTVTRCVSSATSSTTGLTALHSAGFSTAGTAHDGEGFVCRISGRPTEQQDPCIQTPPATAYWSYWHATNGGSWTYSSQGAMSHHVIVGGFEGWSFHSGSGSNTPPTSGNPTRPKPQPTPTVGLGPAASTTHKPAPPTSGKSTTGKPTATKGSPTTAATGTSTSATSLVAGGSTSSTDSAGGALPGDPPGPGRSPWPFVGGATAIGLILAGAGLTVSRRRGSSGV
jgi:hypothetical protein